MIDDIRAWTHQANLSETIAALQKSDTELLEEDPSYEPLGAQQKAELLAQLQAEQASITTR